VLLVGHEPDLSGVIAQLGGGHVEMKKGGLAALRLEGTRGELALVLRPRELSLIAGIPLDGD
jgi:phosphohistidine phosphatase